MSVTDCPQYPNVLPECSWDMHNNELCDADQTLPDGNINFEVDNCVQGEIHFDVFKKITSNK